MKWKQAYLYARRGFAVFVFLLMLHPDLEYQSSVMLMGMMLVEAFVSDKIMANDNASILADLKALEAEVKRLREEHNDSKLSIAIMNEQSSARNERTAEIMGGISNSLEKVTEKLDNIATDVGSLKKDRAVIYWVLGIIGSVAVSVIAYSINRFLVK